MATLHERTFIQYLFHYLENNADTLISEKTLDNEGGDWSIIHMLWTYRRNRNPAQLTASIKL